MFTQRSTSDTTAATAQTPTQHGSVEVLIISVRNRSAVHSKDPLSAYDKLYSPQVVVTIYNKIHNKNDLTKKKRKKKQNAQTNGV